MIPAEFISNHFKGKIQSMKMKLTSDVSDRTWEVKLDGKRFAAGWKDFSVFHSVRDDDLLSFRHDGDMVFPVTPFGRSFSQIQYISSSTSDDEDDEHTVFDDDEDNDVDVGDDDDNSISEEELYSKKVSSKKRARTETESSSDKSYLLAHVTPSSLRRDIMVLRLTL